ncbi:DUF4166 domain-containing protein [Microbacterium sp.]|uniref:DUF4166 domain-containing protein n=1 Tax=Microbacterium sp. TaxID=51671 RepID=UPI003F6ECD26
MTTPSRSESVYQLVLGEGFAAIDPGLRPYFASAPEGTGRGAGTFVTAGSRLRILRPAFAWLARRQILFPEFGRDVPFTVVNEQHADGSLSGIRTLHFAGGDRVLADSMTVDDGRLIDRIGIGGRLEVALDVDVADGCVRLRSTSLALRIGGRRLPLPHVVRVTVDESFSDGRQHVDVRLRSPLVGEVFRYAGSFSYSVRRRSRRDDVRCEQPSITPSS